MTANNENQTHFLETKDIRSGIENKGKVSRILVSMPKDLSQYVYMEATNRGGISIRPANYLHRKCFGIYCLTENVGKITGIGCYYDDIFIWNTQINIQFGKFHKIKVW